MKDFLIIYCTQITIIAFASFSSYVISITVKWWKIPSISESNKKLNKPWRWLFEATMFISGIAIISNGLRIENIGLIIGGGFIFLVGVFNNYKSIVHAICATLGFSITVCSFDWITTLVIFLAAFYTYRNSEDYDDQITTFNVEVILAILLFIRISMTL